MTDTMAHALSFNSPRPPMAEDGDVPYPEAPTDLASTGIDELMLRDLALKLAYTVPQLTTEWAAERLRLPIPIMEALCQGLHRDKLLDILGPSGPACYRYAITQRGNDRAGRLMEISAYVGPAPVSVDAYREATVWQLGRRAPVTPSEVVRGMTGIVLDESDMEVVALAVSSRKSLFLYGPPGNGKTTLGGLIHSTIRGDLWIPYCIQVESSIIQLYDPQCHKLSKELPDPMAPVDERWVRIQPPFLLVGGELNIEQLDLAYSPSHRFYHAPLHLKANGGVYMIDDFGRQRVDTTTLLNRWIMPLESGEDHLTLRTGQQIQVPFLQMLIIATNLEPDRVMNASFLRRMGYRLCLPSPTSERFKKILEEYVAKIGKAMPDGLVERLLTRYRNEHRHFQACEARDLIERARDICRFRERPLELSEEVMDLAWRSYFGRKDTEARRA